MGWRSPAGIVGPMLVGTSAQPLVSKAPMWRPQHRGRPAGECPARRSARPLPRRLRLPPAGAGRFDAPPSLQKANIWRRSEIKAFRLFRLSARSA